MVYLGVLGLRRPSIHLPREALSVGQAVESTKKKREQIPHARVCALESYEKLRIDHPQQRKIQNCKSSHPVSNCINML